MTMQKGDRVQLARDCHGFKRGRRGTVHYINARTIPSKLPGSTPTTIGEVHVLLDDLGDLIYVRFDAVAPISLLDQLAEQAADVPPPEEPSPNLEGAVNVKPCVFCAIADAKAPAKIVAVWDDAVAFVPLNPVTEGHVLVVPRKHVLDATEDPWTTAAVMRRAAEFATAPCNIITSVGAEATQTVFHLHVHVVPRRANDGLHLPWTGQEKRIGGSPSGETADR